MFKSRIFLGTITAAGLLAAATAGPAMAKTTLGEHRPADALRLGIQKVVAPQDKSNDTGRATLQATRVMAADAPADTPAFVPDGDGAYLGALLELSVVADADVDLAAAADVDAAARLHARVGAPGAAAVEMPITTAAVSGGMHVPGGVPVGLGAVGVAHAGLGLGAVGVVHARLGVAAAAAVNAAVAAGLDVDAALVGTVGTSLDAALNAVAAVDAAAAVGGVVGAAAAP